MTVITNPRVALAEAVADLVDNAPVLVDDQIDLDPVADAMLIAQIELGNRLKREQAQIERERKTLAEQIKNGIRAKGHAVVAVNGEQIAHLQTGVQQTVFDKALMQRLAPVAFDKATTVTHDGERLLFK